MKHYVINLKRRLDRLYAWIGAMDRHQFDFSTLTILEAIDASEFTDTRSYLEYIVSIGFSRYQRHLKGNIELDYRTRACCSLKLAIDFILNKIAAEAEKSWSVLWLDDVVLNVDYSFFEQAILTAPSDAEVILFAKGIMSEPVAHETLPFYKGVVGNRGNYCMAVTPDGAKKLLSISATDFWNSYENLMFETDLDTSFIYTHTPDFVEKHEHLFIQPSDFKVDSRPTIWDNISVTDFQK